MPFRHLLFNRRNGAAPRRDLDQQSISLQDAAYFSLEDEFPGYKDNEAWSDHAQSVTQSPTAYNSTMQRSLDHKGHWQQPAEAFDPRNMFPYNSINGVPYQNSPYDFDSNSLQYSSDVAMDTDGSSISRGSIHSSVSSTSHIDVTLDEDLDSLNSLSRKPSLTSTSNHGGSSTLCPLMTGQAAKCSPELCGPAAPCLQYGSIETIPPIEDCVTRNASSTAIEYVERTAINFTSHATSDLGHEQIYSMPVATPHQFSQAETPIADSHSKQIATVERATDQPVVKSTKKGRARQAHSLVERKYRENLNAKIQELHLLLHRVKASRQGPRVPALGLNVDEEDLDDDGAERSTSTRVKKSDVLVEAISYVHNAEREMQRKDEEIRSLHERINMMESWIKNGTMGPGMMMSS